MRIWRLALKARNAANENIRGWSFRASKNGTTFTTLLTSMTVLEGSATEPSFFDILLYAKNEYSGWVNYTPFDVTRKNAKGGFEQSVWAARFSNILH